MKTPGIKTYEEIFEKELAWMIENESLKNMSKRCAKAYASQFVREAAKRTKLTMDSNTILSLLKVIEND